VLVTIDGVPGSFRGGTTILAAASQLGIEIASGCVACDSLH
jgi:NADH dehydrogenase/NADH:ubiquinone oxidoreductase subunit G